jgi:amino acid adenylation domain-containing protein/non-ribosomal peptide synthase protein (TIGR01720 family)
VTPVGELLARARRLQIRLWVEDGHLRYTAPAGALTEALKAELVQAKPALLALLAREGAASRPPTGIPKAPPGEIPLSLAQQRLWYQEQLLDRRDIYIMARALRLIGPLRPDLLHRSYHEIVRRHDILRTTFVPTEHGASQAIAPSLELALPVISLEALSAEAAEGEISHWLHQQRRQPFDLAAGPLLRLTLFRLDPRHHVIVLTMHHIIADGQSVDILHEELRAIYLAFVQGRPSPLPPPRLQYADFAHWQRRRMDDAEMARQLQYWRERLRDCPALLELPSDRPRPPIKRFGVSAHEGTLPPALRDGLARLADRAGASMFLVLAAAFQVLLAKYAGTTDFAIGTTSSIRTGRDLEGVPGFFLNTLVLRSEVRPDRTFEEILAGVTRAFFEAKQHEDVPFDRLVKELNPERSMSHAPLCQAYLTYQHVPSERRSIAGLEIAPVRQPVEGLEYDLHLRVTEIDGALRCHYQFDPDLFDPDTIRSLADHFDTLLRDIVTHPRRRVAELSCVSEDEHGRLLQVEPGPAPPSRSICEAFADAIRQHADRTALIELDEDGRTTRVTYAALDRRVDRLAHRLRRHGLGAGQVAGVCVPRSIEAIVSIMAVLRTGAAYLPIDPDTPSSRLRYVLRDSDASLLIAGPATAAREHDLSIATLRLDRSDAEDPPRAEEAVPFRFPSPHDRCYVMYTSGSTGQPKGVAITHRSVDNYIRGLLARVRLDGDASFAFLSTLSADLWNTALFGSLCTGRPLVLFPDACTLDGEALGRLMAVQPVDCLKIVPSHLAALLASARPDRLLPRQLLIVGGEALDGTLVQTIRSHAQCVIFNEYGPTETTVGVIGFQAIAQASRDPVPIGTPFAGTRAYVVDRDGRLQPTGVPGELWLGGTCLAEGYARAPRATAEKFVPDPFGREPGQRLYRTGDIVRRRPDGIFVFLGRADDQVKIRGYRVEPGEVEAALAAMPDVDQAVVGVDEHDGHRRLVAWVVTRCARAETLQQRLQDLLPGPMIPSRIHLIDRVPLTPNGKVDRRALARLPVDTPRAAAAPMRTQPEEQLGAIWREVLGLAQIGVHDNFYRLGGDSVLTILVVAKARKLGLPLTPSLLFQHQTIAELAASLSETVATVSNATGASNATRASSATREAETEVAPLTPIQRWFFELNLADAHHYTQAHIADVAEPLDLRALQAAADAMAARHDALRLRFTRGEEWRQRADPPGAAAVVVIDLSALPAAARQTTARAAAIALHGSLDYEAGPVWRLACFVDDRRAAWRLLIVAHHLAIDAVSWRILLDDLRGVAVAETTRSPSPAPPPAASYGEWARRLRQHASSPALQSEARYWLQLADTPIRDLPRDFDGRCTVASIRTVTMMLGRDETSRLLQQASAAYRTEIRDVLLTALALAFADWTGSYTLAIDYEGHGREPLFPDLDVSRTVGWFTALYPIVMTLPEARDPGASLKAVKEHLRAIPGAGVGYGLLRYAAPDRALASQLAVLRPQIAFNYLGQYADRDDERAGAAEADALVAPAHSPRQERPHLITIAGAIIGGRLRLHWRFSDAVHRQTSIETVAGACQAHLLALIDHCCRPQSQGCTPSDFPLANLSQPALDRLVASLAPEVEAREIEDIYPLTPLQHGMLYDSLRDPETGFYVFQELFEVSGPLHVETLRAAWQQIGDRHAPLRTLFVGLAEARPLQVVVRRVEMPWIELDWRDRTEAQERDGIRLLLARDRRTGFQLDRAPLSRVTLLRLADDRYRIVWTYHHAITDGWSSGILRQEILSAYVAAVRGVTATLPRRRSFRDYLAWLQTKDRAAAETFWRTQLAGVTRPTPLGILRTADVPDGRPFQRRERTWTLPDAVRDGLIQRARRHEVTLQIVMQAAWGLLLSRYSGDDDVIAGVTTAARPADLADVEAMVGPFINTIPARLRLTGNPRLSAWLAELHRAQVQREEFAYAPLVDIRRWSGLPGHVPLFHTLLVFENLRGPEAVATGDVVIRPGGLSSRGQTPFPLTLILMPARGLTLRLVFDGRLLAGRDIDRLLRHYERILASFALDDDPALSSVPMLSQAERRMTQSTARRLRVTADGRLLHQGFETRAAEQPEALAVIASDRRLRYGELNAGANRLARHLQALGVGPEVRVAVSCRRESRLLTALFAVLKAGGVHVPIDPEYPDERRRFMIEHSRAAVILADSDYADALVGPRRRLVRVDRDEGLWQAQSAGNLPTCLDPDHLAYIIYTSGTTGRPKGVAVTHRNVVAMLAASRQGLPRVALTRVLASMSICFDPSVLEIFLPLNQGGTVILVEHLMALAERDAAREPTMVLTAPSVMEALLRTTSLPASVHTVFFGGEPLHRSLADRVYAQGVTRIYNQYGPSETTTCCTMVRVPRHASGMPSIGRALAGVYTRVLDPLLQPVAPGLAGQLVVGGTGVVRGYVEAPRLTAERFVPDPGASSPGSRIYRTGDLVRVRPDGQLEFLGRSDHQIKIHGRRVELAEIEATLATLAGVREAVAMGIPGPEGARLVAFVTTDVREADASSRFREALARRLPRYMLPSDVVTLDRMPLEEHGKIDRRALAAHLERRTRDRTPPSTELEVALAALWCDLLGVDQLGVHDDFFVLGGHSLLAVQLANRLRDRFGLKLPIKTIFVAPTLAGLAAEIAKLQEIAGLTPATPSDAYDEFEFPAGVES